MKYLPVIVLIIFLVGCRTEEPAPNQFLVETEQIFAFTAQEIQNNLQLAGSNNLASKVKYEIGVYRIIYKTTFKGEVINASGLIGIPLTTEPQPMISLQHGTIAKSSEAPSQSISNYGQLSWFTSFGYIMLFPDFIGYGESDDILHPYYDEESTARSITDMLLAAREFAQEENVNFNGDVFLAGYSEGGYATMAAHKSMEENPMEGFNLVASAPASGGYDVTAMAEYLFAQESYDTPFYITFVAWAYTHTYDWSQSLSLYFNEPYATDIPELFNGVNTAGQINARLTTDITYLIKEDFRDGFNSEQEYEHIRKAFSENSLTDWIPEAIMFMYHGTGDFTVPYENSLLVFNKLKANGAVDIELIDLEGDHSTAFFPYLNDVVDKFDGLK